MPSPLWIAVCTASSTSGTSCIKHLLSNISASGSPGLIVRGCFRTGAKADAVSKILPALATTGNANGITYESHIGFDATDPISLINAFKDCDRALVITPLDHDAGFEKDAQNSINMIKAAIDCGVSRIVHVGSWTVNYPQALPILSARFLPTENYLREHVGNKVEWTVLRGGYFMTNLMGHAQSIKDKGTLNPTPFVKIPIVDTRDIGEAAAALLGGNHDQQEESSFEFHGKFIECCGPQLLSNEDIATTIGQVIGEPVTSPLAPDLEEWCSKVPVPIFVELFRHMVAHNGEGIPYDCSEFSNVMGRMPRSFREFVQDNKDAFVK